MPRWLALAVTSLVLLLPSLALGAEVKVEGIVKAVDAKERTLTVERKTAKGTKELSLEVAKEAGDLSSLKVGDEVSFAYDSTLEVVTEIISPNIKKMLVEKIKAKWDAIQKNDAAILSTLLDDDWEAVFQNYFRAKREPYIKGCETTKVRDVRISEFAIKMVTADVAVMTYRLHRILAGGANPLTIDNLESSVWVNRDGEWKESFVQEASPIPPK